MRGLRKYLRRADRENRNQGVLKGRGPFREYVLEPYNQIYGIYQSTFGGFDITFQDNNMYLTSEFMDVNVRYVDAHPQPFHIHATCGFFFYKERFLCNVDEAIIVILYMAALDANAARNAADF